MKLYWKIAFGLTAIVAYFGQAVNMIASHIAGPATPRQCAANPEWCYYYTHSWPAWLGVVMLILGFALFLTYLERE